MQLPKLKGAIFLMLVLWGSSADLNAQGARTEGPVTDTVSVEFKTLLERYEKGYVPPREERLRLKKERKFLVAFRKSVIDTLPVSKRRKKRLLQELYTTPFTEEWSKVLVDLNFEDPLEDWEY